MLSRREFGWSVAAVACGSGLPGIAGATATRPVDLSAIPIAVHARHGNRGWGEAIL
jgi:hypothetical protein